MSDIKEKIIADIAEYGKQCYADGLKQGRADKKANVLDEFVNVLINPINYERYDFDKCLDDSNKANAFFSYVFAMAEQLKEQNK